MNDFNPSVEQVRNLPGIFDPTSFTAQEAYGQRTEAFPRTIPRSVTASANVNPLDDLIRVDSTSASVTMTLETAVGCDGREHMFIKTVAANSMVIDGNGSETLNGAASVTVTAQYAVVIVKSNGTNWDVILNTASSYQTVFSGSVGTGTTKDVTDIPAGYSEIVITGTGISNDTASRTTLIQVSTDNGANYDTTAGNYDGQFGVGGVLADTTLASLAQMSVVLAAATQTFTIIIKNYDGLGGNAFYEAVAISSTGQSSFTKGIFTGFTTAINAVRLLLNGSGNFDAGTVTVIVR